MRDADVIAMALEAHDHLRMLHERRDHRLAVTGRTAYILCLLPDGAIEFKR